MYGNDDLGVRYTNLTAGGMEWLHRMAGNELVVALLCALVVILLIALVERKKQAIAASLSLWTAWCVGFIGSTWTMLLLIRGKKAMRKKNQEDFSKHVQTVLIHMVDVAIEKGRITQTMGNAELRKLARAYPALRLAIWHPVDTKEAVVERRKNTDRNLDGTIVPLPLP